MGGLEHLLGPPFREGVRCGPIVPVESPHSSSHLACSRLYLPAPLAYLRAPLASPSGSHACGHRYMADDTIQDVVEKNLGKILLVLVLILLALFGSVRSFLKRSLRRR